MDFLWKDYERYKDALTMGKEPYKLREIEGWLKRHAAETKKHPLASYLGKV